MPGIPTRKNRTILRLTIAFITILNVWILFPGEMKPMPLWYMEMHFDRSHFFLSQPYKLIGASLLIVGQLVAVVAIFSRKLVNIGFIGVISNLILLVATTIIYLFQVPQNFNTTFYSGIPFMAVIVAFWGGILVYLYLPSEDDDPKEAESTS